MGADRRGSEPSFVGDEEDPGGGSSQRLPALSLAGRVRNCPAGKDGTSDRREGVPEKQKWKGPKRRGSREWPRKGKSFGIRIP